MENNNASIVAVLNIPQDVKDATALISGILCNNIWPTIISIQKNIMTLENDDEKIYSDAFTLCCSQILKCITDLLEVFKLEHQHQMLLQESRQCLMERLSWCIQRLESVDRKLGQKEKINSNNDVDGDDSLLTPRMYFVNWIDHAFEVLTKLSSVIYKTDHKESMELSENWKRSVVDCVSDLHFSIEELLLSAMTLCKYCLPSDQYVVKARCQVVLRETKALLGELVNGNINSTLSVTKDTLKLPVKPSNVNVLIDVLKDVLYVLETNTNTALLSLLVCCFSNAESPVDVLKSHFKSGHKGACPCLVKSDEDLTEDCTFVKEFDLYNERLLQIGSFAVSCSSDQHRILTLRSGLASLEALDPHLVPSIMVSPDSHHATLLVKSWRQEVHNIRNNVFLIVDPAAFAEKCKQMLHQNVLDIIEINRYNNSTVCTAINIGCVILDFFTVYNKNEPDALIRHDKLLPLLADLMKVTQECKTVSNLLCDGEDFLYEIKKTNKNKKEANFEQLIKRLKLLYTLVSRINFIFHPKDNDDQLFANEEDVPPAVKQNETHTINAKNADTYNIQSPRKITNMSRSMFARTNTRSVNNNFVLSRLTKHLKLKRKEEMSFSMHLDELLSESNSAVPVVNKHLRNVLEPSILYNYSPNKRSALRKMALNRNFEPEVALASVVSESDAKTEHDDLVNESTSLQITEILDQIADISRMFSTTKLSLNSTHATCNKAKAAGDDTQTNVLTLNINNQNTSIARHVWNIPVNTSTVEMCLDKTSDLTGNSTASSQPSNVTTMERLNDLDLVDSKLMNLIFLQKETSL